jgi:hypothetical protein
MGFVKDHARACGTCSNVLCELRAVFHELLTVSGSDDDTVREVSPSKTEIGVRSLGKSFRCTGWGPERNS